MIELNKIFNLNYGNGFGLNTLTQDNYGINFISRSSLNNGVSCRVGRISGVEPFPAGTVTVALSGSVLESFVQSEPFYTAFHIFCLTPIDNMTFNEKLFYCMCIKANKYRYNYGRQANRTLKDILVPSRDEIPDWVYDESVYKNAIESSKNFAFTPFSRQELVARTTRFVEPLITVGDLFDVVYGTNLELNRLQRDKNGINFVSRTSKNNGVSAKVKRVESLDPISAGMLTVAAGGSVLETFVQIEPFYSGRDLYYLNPKINLTLQEKIYYCMCIKKNKYKYNYGRQANRTLRDILIPSPDNMPEWVNNLSIKQDVETPLENIVEEIDML